MTIAGYYEYTLLAALAGSMSFFATAQKLPNKQGVSVRAPDNIKIDGKTTEWNDEFQAHNWGNHIYYTLSNDDNNLYLTACMDDMLGNRKILRGGLTFSILPLSKKAKKLSITFPVASKNGIGSIDVEESGGGPLFSYSILKSDTVANKAKIDSLIAISNREIAKEHKEIYITGIPEISDPLLSIYNTQGIIAGASFDKKMRYTYELAIPLKYLEAAISNAKSIRYNIKLNVLSPIIEAKRVTYSGPPIRELKIATQLRPESLNDLFIYNDSDFSGEYTLAKK